MVSFLSMMVFKSLFDSCSSKGAEVALGQPRWTQRPSLRAVAFLEWKVVGQSLVDKWTGLNGH